mgnify:CR=1 FL=1
MKKYFFALGTNPDLSLAELTSLFPDNDWYKSGSIVMSDFLEDLQPQELMSVLGGTIKIGEIIKEISLANRRALSEKIKEEAFIMAEKNVTKRFNFGFSFYNKKVPGDFFKLGLAIKRELKEEGISSRMVTSRDIILSSVIVEQNKLIEDGIEFCLIVEKNRVFLGKTLVVQPFKDLSKRDFGRPARDDHSGMIPPKLAQIMINLARSNDNIKDKILLDPFCGSGTILMEAYLMGFNNIIGSDLSDKAVSDSQENIDWIINLKKDNQKNNINIFQSDVLNLEKHIKKNSVDYIVCEPYLGPQRGFQDFDMVVDELNRLYSGAINIFSKILKKNGRVVMIWPYFRSIDKVRRVKPETFGFDYKSIGVYGRDNQKVWREIIILQNGV